MTNTQEKFKGQDGKDGIDGKDGKDGKDGLNGRDGKDGQDGINGRDGEDGRDGRDGVDGVDGQDGESLFVNVKDFGADVNNEDNTQSFIEATNYAIENKLNLLINEDYKVSGNIRGFSSAHSDFKVKHYGTGSIIRNGHTFKITPTLNDITTLHVSDSHNYMNDGLTPEHTIALSTALRYLKNLGERSLNGQWQIKLHGTIQQRGSSRNLLDLPYFSKPLLITGNRNENDEITTIIDGSENNIDNYWWYNDTGSSYQKYYIFKDLKFTNWRNHATGSGAIVCWDNSDVSVLNCEADNCSRLAWIRNGRLIARYNKVSNGYTAFTVQYHTSFNIEENDISNN